MRAALFPGQGFQKFGMLAELARTHPEITNSVVSQVEDVLPGLELGRMLLGTGNEVDVTSTEIAQPLLLANSIAHFRSHKNPDFKLFMGHSLGEYSCFVANGMLPLSEGLRLLRARGLAMSRAAKMVGAPNGMTLLKKPIRVDSGVWNLEVKQAALEANCDIAAYNSPDTTVVSGKIQDLNELVAKLSANHRFIAKPLPVSGAFHSRYMRPAAEDLREIVKSANWKFAAGVVSNVTAKPYLSVQEAQECCVTALTSPVRWCESVEFALSFGTTEFEQFGGDIGALMRKYIR